MNQGNQLSPLQEKSFKNKGKFIATASVLFLATITLAGCSNKNSDVSQLPVSEEVSQKAINSQERTEEPMGPSLEEVFKKIGMRCSGPDFQATCSWNGKSFTISKPSDWNKDIQTRNKACDDGFINPEYLLVSDNKSWRISTDYNEDVVSLSEALTKEGVEAKAIRYCH